MTSELPPGAVLVIGAGLIGTSVGLALRAHGISVHLADVDAAALDVAVSRGAGTSGEPSDVGLAVAAVPPRSLGTTLVAALERWSGAVVTDVGSVKALPLAELLAAGTDVSRYAGGHPMAGSERSGPAAASADLFTGRPWAVTPHERSSEPATEAARALALLCGAVLVELSPQAHDAAVARVSHLPHLMATLMAAQLPSAPSQQLALAGQGLRDVTRVAAGDPALWSQILAANAEPLRELLRGVRGDLDGVVRALGGDDVVALEELLARGRHGSGLVRREGAGAPGWEDRGVTGLVIAVDGPSGSGKSSTARGVATRLGLRYLDTGAMYRAMTWALLERQIDVEDSDAVTATAPGVVIEPGTDPVAPTIRADGVDVSIPIRGPAVTAAVSAVSAVPQVRQLLVRLQRRIIGDGGIVVEGRDIGSIVVPDAAVKVFLIADPAARAARRAAEQGRSSADVTLTQQDMARRDRLDSSRRASPLTRAPDAVVIDTTEQTLEDTVEQVVALAQPAARGAATP